MLARTLQIYCLQDQAQSLQCAGSTASRASNRVHALKIGKSTRTRISAAASELLYRAVLRVQPSCSRVAVFLKLCRAAVRACSWVAHQRLWWPAKCQRLSSPVAQTDTVVQRQSAATPAFLVRLSSVIMLWLLEEVICQVTGSQLNAVAATADRS